MSNQTDDFNRYTVTYSFSGHLREDYTEAISRIRETVEELNHEDVAITFVGATLEIHHTARPNTITARYEAPSKGTIGWLNCRARLPACGPPQREDADTTESDRISHGRTERLPNG